MDAEAGMEKTMRIRQTLRMARGEVARIRPVPGAEVRVRRGRIWLTEFGGGRDWSLGCGAAHALAVRGVAVIECTSPAIVEVAAPASWVTLAREAAGRWFAPAAPRTGSPA
jgi:hypothetical protein